MCFIHNFRQFFSDGIFSSDSLTWIFWGYIGVGKLLVNLYEWSSSAGLSVATYEKR